MTTETDGNPAQPGETKHARRLMTWGLAASAVYILGMAIYAWFVRDLMFQMRPADFATFLSGVFAPLAFLWLVLGFKQQGDELQNSARALWLQGEELRNSVEQQRQLVDVAREQLSTELEARVRAEAEAETNAQPVLHASPTVANEQDGSFGLLMTITSAGPTCREVVFSLGEHEGWTGILHATATIRVQLWFAREDMQDMQGRVTYTDARGMRKRQIFEITLFRDDLGWAACSEPQWHSEVYSIDES